MGEITGISWCDATINFWHGCEKISEGCKFCYMFRDKERWKQDGKVIVKSKLSGVRSTLNKLMKAQEFRKLSGNKDPLKIFTCSWSDFFIEQADQWRAEAWDIIRDHPQFVWIILTKRPERMKECFPPDWGKGWDNVWLVVSAENQDRAEERIPILLDTPAKVRGVSCEPLLGEIRLKDLNANRFDYPGYGFSTNALLGISDSKELPFTNKLDWVIVGGESGNETGKWLYRPCEISWIERIVEECLIENVPVFVKQLGTDLAKKMDMKERHGNDVREFPSYMRVQHFPKKVLV